MGVKLFMVEEVGRVEEDGITSPIYKRKDGTGEAMDFDALPIGACFVDPEYAGGRVCVKIPHMDYSVGTLFHTYSRDNNGHFWDWKGEPPNLTVTPSIWHKPDGWHGYIRDGEIVDA